MTENRPQLNAIEEEGTVAGARTRKPYSKPAIIHEQQIEISVGTPLGRPLDPLDPLGLMGTRR